MQAHLRAQPLPAVSMCDGTAVLRMRTRQPITALSAWPPKSACRRPSWDTASAAASPWAARHAQQYVRAAISAWGTWVPSRRRSARQTRVAAASSSATTSFNEGSLPEPSSGASCVFFPKACCCLFDDYQVGRTMREQQAAAGYDQLHARRAGHQLTASGSGACWPWWQQ